MTADGDRPGSARREQRALRTSMAVAAVLGVVALCWGWAAGAQVILLDGVYTVLGLGMSWLALLTSRVVALGPTRRFPFGRDPLVPLVVAVQGIALAGTFAYAVVEAVRVILAGGSEVAAGSLAAYGAVSGLVGLAGWRYLRRGEASDLLRAEAAGWLAGAVGSLVVTVGAGFALVLRAAGWVGTVAYVDSALVLATCALLAPVPVRMVRQAVRELLSAAPEPEVQRPIRELVERVRAAEGLPEPVLRTSRVAHALYVEVGFVVTAGRWDIADEDRVRRALRDGLADLPYESWLVVEITTDADLVR
ncbi:MAG: cation transporter [Saccharothrix sp.]|nr:cation transporter [Saccharothrix sp.]